MLKDLAALHYISMDEINRRFQFWARAWSRHRIRTVKASPIQFWMSDRPVFEPVSQILTEYCRVSLSVDLRRNTCNRNFGIDDY